MLKCQDQLNWKVKKEFINIVNSPENQGRFVGHVRQDTNTLLGIT